MKARIESEVKEFKPFDIVFTIESKRELELLWTLFNIGSPSQSDFFNNSGGRIVNWSNKEIEPFTQAECQSILNTIAWKTLDDKLKEISK